jgi:hypothetical protein
MNMKSEPPSGDILGLAPYGEAINTAVEKAGEITKLCVEKSFEAAEKFFSTICGPAASEVGLLMRDSVRVFRAKNLASIADKAKAHVTVTEDGVQLSAPPRLVHELIESGSWCDDDGLQKLWAGLLASSVTPDGKDEFGLIFADILKRITPAEAKVIDYACRDSKKEISEVEEILASWFYVDFSKFASITGISELSQAGFLISHIRALGLFRSADDMFSHIKHVDAKKRVEITPRIHLTPSRLALEFYVRCQGSRKTPREFFNVEPNP